MRILANILFCLGLAFLFGAMGLAASYIVYLGVNETLVAVVMLVGFSTMVLSLRDFFRRKRVVPAVEVPTVKKAA